MNRSMAATIGPASVAHTTTSQIDSRRADASDCGEVLGPSELAEDGRGDGAVGPPCPRVVERFVHRRGERHVDLADARAGSTGAAVHRDEVCVRTHTDHPVSGFPGEPRASLAGRGDEDSRRYRRPFVERQVLDPPVGAVVVHRFATPERSDHVDRFGEPLSSLGDARPALRVRLLVESLAGPDAEHEPPPEQHRRRCRGVRHVDRMVPRDHRGHAHTDLDAIGLAGDRADGRPHMSRMSLRGSPRLQMVGDHHGVEPDRVGPAGVANELHGVVLLGRQPPAEPDPAAGWGAGRRRIRHGVDPPRRDRSATRRPP